MVKITKDKGVNKDGFQTGGVEVSDSKGKVGIDPRSKILTLIPIIFIPYFNS